jgi:hypothetical protein
MVLLVGHGDAASDNTLMAHLCAAWNHLGYCAGCVDLTLSARSDTCLTLLEQLLQEHHYLDVMVLRVPISWLAEDLSELAITPLVAVAANSSSVLTAYQALKLLLSQCWRQPTVVPVMSQLDAAGRQAAEKLSQSIAACSDHFLGKQPHMAAAIGPSPSSDTVEARSPSILALALRLMEPATPYIPRWSH